MFRLRRRPLDKHPRRRSRGLRGGVRRRVGRAVEAVPRQVGRHEPRRRGGERVFASLLDDHETSARARIPRRGRSFALRHLRLPPHGAGGVLGRGRAAVLSIHAAEQPVVLGARNQSEGRVRATAADVYGPPNPGRLLRHAERVFVPHGQHRADGRRRHHVVRHERGLELPADRRRDAARAPLQRGDDDRGHRLVARGHRPRPERRLPV
mmetsp:Transcript_12699/g.39232  ORF Transcript_12699/g.39232 Transcript_12699/m.39232 type:complete len:209 (+) Transcript_12699:422-1048(+)